MINLLKDKYGFCRAESTCTHTSTRIVYPSTFYFWFKKLRRTPKRPWRSWAVPTAPTQSPRGRNARSAAVKFPHATCLSQNLIKARVHKARNTWGRRSKQTLHGRELEWGEPRERWKPHFRALKGWRTRQLRRQGKGKSLQRTHWRL